MSETETIESEQQEQTDEQNTPESPNEQTAVEQQQSASSEETAPESSEKPDTADTTPNTANDADSAADTTANTETANTTDNDTDTEAEQTSDEQQQSDAPKYKTIKAEPEKIEPAPPKDIKIPDIPELQRILKLQVPIIVRLAEKPMRVAEILDMNPGIIIEFDKTVDEPLDLMINNKCIGHGQTVKVGENFGLKVTKITSLGQIIQAMGQEE